MSVHVPCWRRSIVWATLCVTSISGTQAADPALPGATAESDGPSVVRTIIDALRARDTDLNPILIEYRARHFESAVFLAAVAEALGNTLDESPLDLRYETSAMLARKGQLIHHSLTGPRVAEGRIVDETETTRFLIYDGTQSVTGTRPETMRYRISKNSPATTFMYETPWSVLNQDRATAALSWQLEQGTVPDELSIEESRLDGGPAVLRLQLPMVDVSVLPELGYALSAFEYRNESGNLLNRFSADWEMVEGIPIPMSSLSQTFSGDDEELVYKETEVVVQRVTTDPNQISDELFEVTIPTGAEVYDEDLRVLVRDPEAAQATLDGIPERPSSWRMYYFILVNLGLAGIVVAILVWRNRKGKRI